MPVLMDAVSLPLGFRSIQAADLIGWHGQLDSPGLLQLIDDIQMLLGPSDPQSTPRRSTPHEPVSADSTAAQRLQESHRRAAFEVASRAESESRSERSLTAIHDTRSGWVGSLLLIQLAGLAIASPLAYLDGVSIIYSGPLLSAVGLWVAFLGRRAKNRYVVAAGSSTLLVSLLVLALIAGLAWSPDQARIPVTAIAAFYTLLFGSFVVRFVLPSLRPSRPAG